MFRIYIHIYIHRQTAHAPPTGIASRNIYKNTLQFFVELAQGVLKFFNHKPILQGIGRFGLLQSNLLLPVHLRVHSCMSACMHVFVYLAHATTLPPSHPPTHIQQHTHNMHTSLHSHVYNKHTSCTVLSQQETEIFQPFLRCVCVCAPSE